MEYIFLKDKIVHQSEASISVFDLGLLRGYGVFDFFKVHEGVPVFADDHIARFTRSSSLLHLQAPISTAQFKEIVMALIEKNNIQEGTFRFVLTGGISSNGITLDGEPCLIIIPAAFSFKIYTAFDQMKPMRLKLIEYVRETPEIKSLNYLVPMMHWPEVIQGKYDDVLYVKDGWISETSRANIFFVTQDDVLVTPIDNVLMGITRKYILQLAREVMKVEERSISLDEAFSCKEAFLSSSTKQVMPVIDIDGQLIHRGQSGIHTKKLFDLFYAFEMKHIQTMKAHLV